eukprot:242313-Amphidinium_carterae.1
MSAGKLELVPALAQTVRRSTAARALEMSAAEAWQLAYCAVELGAAETTQLRCGGGVGYGLSLLVDLTAPRED